jgi:hypothetical protein
VSDISSLGVEFAALLDRIENPEVGTVQPGTVNAVWGMQFIWPIKAEYVVVYLSDDYDQTIIGRSARDYAWVMARTPAISDAAYSNHLPRLEALGYDVKKVRRVPQSLAVTTAGASCRRHPPVPL